MSFFTGPTAIIASLAYVGLLFFIAWQGDRKGRRIFAGRRRSIVYALSLAVYCTSWTYYGSVGVASERGLDFLPIYIGPILVVGFAYRFIERVAKLAREQNLTTVADFVSARYGKSQTVASVAALIALIASAPYIALQLKAITETVLMVIAAFDHGRLAPVSPPPLFPLAVAALLALFAMAFGSGASIRPSISTASSSLSPPSRCSSSSPSSQLGPSSCGVSSAVWANCRRSPTTSGSPK